MMDGIGFCIIATNAFFTLGLRFVNRFHHFYRGEEAVSFYFFSDQDPGPYLPDAAKVKFMPVSHAGWVEGVNAKPRLLLSLLEANLASGEFSYLYYVDADTGIAGAFDELSFQGDLVGLEHFMNWEFEQPEDYPFDRFESGASYIPVDSPLDNFYYHACFYGGRVDNMQKLCEAMDELYQLNQRFGHEPIWNDESLLNYCFHHSPPFRTIAPADFPFLISDKGGLGDMRDSTRDLTGQAALFRRYRNKLIDLKRGLVWLGK